MGKIKMRYILIMVVMFLFATMGVASALGATVNVTIDIKPNTLNIDSNGVFTAFIKFTTEYESSVIFPESVACEGISAIKVQKCNGANHDYLVQFDVEDFSGLIETGSEVPLKITGVAYHDGGCIDFEEVDIVRVIQKAQQEKGRKK